ncbi:MAG TPA: RidA family protein [Stellaceae bacterium]|jgi:enamine deaminase RidA (YjgF/YER057c/UK114 family)|nr:RidA family protein [Stellaceae bacterium]
MTIERHRVGARMSQAVAYGQTVYLAGQVADTPAAGVRQQTEEVLRKIDELLAAAGTDNSKLLSATIWLCDMRHFDEMNAVWDAWVSAGNTPGRACVEARLAAPYWKVEIAVVAARE